MSVDWCSSVSTGQHTEWKVVIALDGHVLRLFHVVDTLQDCQTMTHARNSHALEVVMLQRYERFADDFVLYTKWSVPVEHTISNDATYQGKHPHIAAVQLCQ